MIDSPSKYRARVKVLMLATCRGAKRDVNSMTTRPPGNSTYSVLSRSTGRQSAAVDAAKTSGILGCLAASADAGKKASAPRIKNLKSLDMRQLLHNGPIGFAEDRMRRTFIYCLTLLALLGADVQLTRAVGQGYPGGGQMSGRGSMSQPHGETSTTPSVDKPDAAAKKAFKDRKSVV